MPDVCFEPALKPSQAVSQTIVFPIGATLLLPALVAMLTEEKSKGLYGMQRLEGMQAPAFFVSTYLFGIMLCGAGFLLLLVVGWLAGLATLKNAGVMVPLALCFGWAHAQVGLAVFLSAVMQRSPRVATLLSYIVVVAAAVFTALLNPQAGASLSLLGGGGIGAVPLMLAPPIAFARALAIVLVTGTDSSLPLAIGMLFVGGTLYLVVGAYLFLVIPDGKGVSESPLFCLEALRSSPPPSSSGAAKASESYSLTTSDGESPTISSEGTVMDSDVIAETVRVRASLPGPQCDPIPSAAVVLRELRKRFPTTQAGKPDSVGGVSLCMEFGEVHLVVFTPSSS
jgi:hypothetical protein